jgi:hypothetical protein
MSENSSRLQTAQWVIERQLAWIVAADAKVAVVVAIDTAMIAALATAFTATKSATPWAIALSLAAVLFTVVATACAAISLLPRTSGPPSSLLYFGTVAKYSPADYIEAFSTASVDELLQDWALQIHRNAEIAARKHLLVRRAVCWSFAAALPWVFAVGLLVRP